MDSLNDYFERVVVINLDRRPDRWDRFRQAFETVDWPFIEPVRVSAVDGDAVTVPIWWKQGGGAWGCLMSHVRILEDCIREGVRRVLILEDDAVLVKDFAAQVRPFLEHVPEDWDQLYFGGQHLRDPIPHGDHVYRCVNVNRTHCHAVSRKFMSRMYRYILNAHDYLANSGHHIDHRLGALQESGTVKAYSPIKWLAGQGEDRSDISGRSTPTYFWETWRGVPSMSMVAVLGLHQGGANLVAGLMKELGVHFGHRLGGYEEPHVEDEGLASICEKTFPFPRTDRWLKPDDTSPQIYDWCRLILQEAANYGTVGAACYPHLCAMYADMSRGWKQLKAIDVECDFAEAVLRLQQRSDKEKGWLKISAEEAVTVQRFLEEGKQEWRRQCECLRVDPRRVAEDRNGLVKQLREFLGLHAVAKHPAAADF
jgi:hypothetical protein